MKQTSGQKAKPSVEAALRDIGRVTRRRFSVKEKARPCWRGCAARTA